MIETHTNSFAQPTVFHSMGGVRLITPLEDAALRERFGMSAPPPSETRSYSSPARRDSLAARAVDALRRWLRFWVEAQTHRSGV
jgi:hypothetical protein